MQITLSSSKMQFPANLCFSWSPLLLMLGKGLLSCSPTTPATSTMKLSWGWWLVKEEQLFPSLQPWTMWLDMCYVWTWQLGTFRTNASPKVFHGPWPKLSTPHVPSVTSFPRRRSQTRGASTCGWRWTILWNRMEAHPRWSFPSRIS